jgi:hypothetical protein
MSHFDAESPAELALTGETTWAARVRGTDRKQAKARNLLAGFRTRAIMRRSSMINLGTIGKSVYFSNSCGINRQLLPLSSPVMRGSAGYPTATPQLTMSLLEIKAFFSGGNQYVTIHLAGRIP